MSDSKAIELPLDLLRSYRWRCLKPTSRDVYIFMQLPEFALKHEPDQVSFSEEELAESSGLSLSTVKRGLSELQASGLISKVRRGARWYRQSIYAFERTMADAEQGSA